MYIIYKKSPCISRRFFLIKYLAFVYFIIIFDLFVIYFSVFAMSLKQRKQILDDPTISISNIWDWWVVLDFDKFYLDFKNKIKSEVSEILIWNLQEDVFLTEKEYQKAPYRVKGFLNYSEKRGLRYYLFDYKWLKYMFIGAFWSWI